MMSKFTKGKWEVYSSTNSIGVFDEDGELVKTIADSIYGDETNARLIAASPEMYELLREELIPTSDYGGIVSFEREKKIRTLLAWIDGEDE